ncbi:Imm26 family immunity protein [Kribbella deserti]|uniref:Imm26 family immunity protein n=1 Tax=Kribbella deserti TaxID=1926257 RepID=A0ABV6QS14_9ACTN
MLLAIPLHGERAYGSGVVARSSGVMLLIYFSGQKFTSLPAVSQAVFEASEAVWVKFVGDLGILKGTWKTVGPMPDWDREKWPVPIFGHTEELSGRYFRTKYDDELAYRGQALSTEEVVRNLPEDGFAGFEFAELRMTRLLKGVVPQEV